MSEEWKHVIITATVFGFILGFVAIVGHNLDLNATREHEELQTKVGLEHHWMDLQQARLEYAKETRTPFSVDRYPFGTSIVTQGKAEVTIP